MSIDLLTATAADLQSLMQQGALTSRDLVYLYVERTAKYNDYLKAVIAIAPIVQLHTRASILDRERADGNLRGPLHGIPILIKVPSQYPRIREICC
jgi:amidase